MVAALEHFQFRTCMVDALCENHKWPECIALIVCALCEISVGGEQPVHLLQESSVFSAKVCAVKSLVNQILAVCCHTSHADGSCGPGAVIMHFIECL